MLKSGKFLYQIIVAIGILIYLLIHASYKGDLLIFELGSNDIVHGIDAFSKKYVDGYHYYYSALFAILIYPLYLLPVYIGTFIWLLLNVVLLARVVVLCSRYFDINKLSEKQFRWFLILTIVFALRFIFSNLNSQQITIVILYLVLEGIALINSDKKAAGAVLIALGINIKLLPLVILPYLLYRKEWKAFLFTILLWIIMLYLPGLVLGFQQNNLLIASWWNLINPSNAIHVVDVDERSFHGLSTLLATLLMEHVPDHYALPIKRNIADVSYSQLTWILNITRLILVSFTLYFLRTKPFVSISNKLHKYCEVSYLLLLVPLIFPHQQPYAFLFIMPAVSFIIYYLITHYKVVSQLRFTLMLSFLVISYLCCNFDFIFGEFREYYTHFKILTYGALIIIPLLAFSFPLKNKEAI